MLFRPPEGVPRASDRRAATPGLPGRLDAFVTTTARRAADLLEQQARRGCRRASRGSSAAPAALADEHLVQLRAREGPHRLRRLLLRNAERAGPASASTTTRRFASRSACARPRSSASSGSARAAPAITARSGAARSRRALMSAAKIRSCSCWSVATASARGPSCSGTGRDRIRGRRREELADQRALVTEARVDRFLGDAGGARDRSDARALVAALPEERRRRGEHLLARLLRLFLPPRRTVRRRLTSRSISGTVSLYWIQ